MGVGDRVEFIGAEMQWVGWPRRGDRGVVKSAAPDGSQFIVLFDRFKNGVLAFGSRIHTVQCKSADIADEPK